MSYNDKAVSSVFWTAIQQFGSQGITFVVSILLARILEPEDFGTIALIGVISGLAALLMNSGMTISLVRTKELQQEDLSTVFFFNVGISLLLYGIVFWTAPLVEQFYQVAGLTEIIRVYSVIFVIQAFSAVQKTLISKALEFRRLLFIQLPSLIVGSIAGIVMAYFGFGVWALVYMAIVQYVLESAQFWLKSEFRPQWIFHIPSFKKHFGFGINITLSTIINVLFQNLYVVYIGKVFSPGILGFYNRAESLRNLPVSNIKGILRKILVPFFSTIHEDRDLKRYYRRIISSVLFLLSPVLTLLIFQAEPIIRILLTEKWIQVAPYLQILCFAGFLLPLGDYNIHVLVVKGRSDLILRLEVFKKIITVIVFGISLYWGIYGLLVGQVVNSIIIYVLNSWYTKRMIDYSNLEQLKDIIPFIGVSLVWGGLTYLITGPFLLNIQNDYIEVVAFSSLFALGYIGSAKLLRWEVFKGISDIMKRQIFSR